MVEREAFEKCFESSIFFLFSKFKIECGWVDYPFLTNGLDMGFFLGTRKQKLVQSD